MFDEREKHLRISEERWNKRLARKEKKQDQRRQGKGAEPDVPAGSYKSPVLDLFHEFQPHKDRVNAAPKQIILPPDFSLTRNTAPVLNLLREIVKSARTSRRARLILDHRKVKNIGLGAEALLALILKEISLENRHVNGSYIRGYKAQDSKVRSIMDNIGCVRVLGSGVDEDITVSLKPGTLVFRHYNRGKKLVVDSSTVDPISKATADFSDHLNECLSLTGRRLTIKGRLAFAEHMGEVLINAQEHSGSAHWLVVGFIDTEDQETTYRAAIISLGNTIADTFRALDGGSYPLQLILPYVEKHEKSGFFSPTWTVESLLNVVSLQGNISSKLDGPENDRGQGTVDLIEFFQDMSSECVGAKIKPALSILSGNSLIRFDGTYRMKYELDVRRKVVAFNVRNSLMDPPDTSAVTATPGPAFPGVMISISVPLSNTVVEIIDSEK